MNNPDLNTEIADLNIRLDRIESQGKELFKKLEEKHPKDFWDKLGLLSSLFSSFLVAAIGGIFTYVYQSEQNARDELLRQQQAQMQKLDTIGKFMPYLVGKDNEAKKLALLEVQSFLNTTVAVELAKEVNTTSGPEITITANQTVVTDAPNTVADALTTMAARATNPQDKALATTAATEIRCGVERFKVKTLSDPAASSLNSPPKPTTVASLISLPRPDNLQTDSRYPGIENQIFEVRAKLVSFKEESDNDYHLVIADPADPTKTMVAEIPAPECAPQNSHALDFESARRAVVEKLGPATSRFQSGKDVSVTIVGVGFYDFFHRQTGMAPNGIELHPVLRIAFLPAPN